MRPGALKVVPANRKIIREPNNSMSMTNDVECIRPRLLRGGPWLCILWFQMMSKQKIFFLLLVFFDLIGIFVAPKVGFFPDKH